MANPNPSPKTRIRSGKDAETKGRKGGKASGKTRANYANWKACFKQRMTPEQMDQMYDKLWTLFYKSNNLNALEVLLKGLDDDSERKDSNITVKFCSEDMDEYGD